VGQEQDSACSAPTGGKGGLGWRFGDFSASIRQN
jgi:hypothetical protein